MDAKQLRLLMPKDAQDLAAARELLSAAPDELAPVVPEMLRHLKHHESPVSEAYAEFFAKHGERFLSPVLLVLGRGTLPVVKQVLLAKVLPSWSRESVSKCAGALTMLATDNSPFDTDVLAIRLLARHQLAEEPWLRQWMTFKATRAQARLRLLDEVTAEI